MIMIGKDYSWFAIYVIRHHEKRVYDWVRSLGVEVLFPTKKTRKVWSDRVKIIEEALFPSYLFVKVSCIEYFQVLSYPSILKYVSFNGEIAKVPDCQIKLIRSVIDGNIESNTYESRFFPGERVSVGYGPLRGVAGVLQEFNTGKRLRVRIEIIGYSLLLSIPENLLVKENAAHELSV